MGANMYGQPLPFKVQHIAEFLAEQVREGRLRLRKVAKSATFHDPCQVVRRGGAIEAPREVLKALGLELREMYPTKGTNWCCGGEAGWSRITAPTISATRRSGSRWSRSRRPGRTARDDLRQLPADVRRRPGAFQVDVKMPQPARAGRRQPPRG